MDSSIHPQLIANSLFSGSLYALVSVGLCLSYGLLRILNFAHGQFLSVGAYLYYSIVILLFAGNTEFGSLLLSFLLGVAALTIISYFALKLFIEPLLAFSPLLPFVSTMALGTIIEMVLSLIYGVQVKSIAGGLESSSFEIAGAFVTPVQLFTFVSSIIILGVLGLVINYTAYGRVIRCIAQNKYAAQSLGVNVKKISLIVFCASILLAGYVGALVGITTNVQPLMGNAYTIKGFAAMVVGGLGNVWGAILGSFLLAIVENYAIGMEFWGWSLPSGYKDAFSFVIILLVLLVRPQGLFAFKKRNA